MTKNFQIIKVSDEIKIILEDEKIANKLNHYASRVLTGSIQESGWGIFTNNSEPATFYFKDNLATSVNFSETWQSVEARLIDLPDYIELIKNEIQNRISLVEANKLKAMQNSDWALCNSIGQICVSFKTPEIKPLMSTFSRHLTSTTGETGYGLFSNIEGPIKFERGDNKEEAIDFGQTWVSFLKNCDEIADKLTVVKSEIIRRASLVNEAFDKTATVDNCPEFRVCKTNRGFKIIINSEAPADFGYYTSRILTRSTYESSFGLFGNSVAALTSFKFGCSECVEVNFGKTWDQFIDSCFECPNSIYVIEKEIKRRVALVAAARVAAAVKVKSSKTGWELVYKTSNGDLEVMLKFPNEEAKPLNEVVSRCLTDTIDESGYGIFARTKRDIRFVRDSAGCVLVQFKNTWPEFLSSCNGPNKLALIKEEILSRAKLVQDNFAMLVPIATATPTADYLFVQHESTAYLYIKVSFLERLSNVAGLNSITVLGQVLNSDWGYNAHNVASLNEYKRLYIESTDSDTKKDFKFLKAILDAAATFAEPPVEEPQETEAPYTILEV